jgi:hypothetical protein
MHKTCIVHTKFDVVNMWLWRSQRAGVNSPVPLPQKTTEKSRCIIPLMFQTPPSLIVTAMSSSQAEQPARALSIHDVTKTPHLHA